MRLAMVRSVRNWWVPMGNGPTENFVCAETRFLGLEQPAAKLLPVNVPYLKYLILHPLIRSVLPCCLLINHMD